MTGSQQHVKGKHCCLRGCFGTEEHVFLHVASCGCSRLGLCKELLSALSEREVLGVVVVFVLG